MNPTMHLPLYPDISKSRPLIRDCPNSQDLFKRSQPPTSHHSPAETAEHWGAWPDAQEGLEGSCCISCTARPGLVGQYAAWPWQERIPSLTSSHLICPSSSCRKRKSFFCCTGRQPLTTQWYNATQCSISKWCGIIGSYDICITLQEIMLHHNVSYSARCLFVSWIYVLLMAV